jgi:DNA polymerase-3 subunit epsilon
MFGLRKRSTCRVDKGAPITAVRYVAVDTELTGLDGKKDSIVSIGAVRMTGGAIHLGGMFYRLVNPGTALTRESIVVHEITPSEVAAKPGIGTVLREFLGFCGADVLVGHFVSIDMEFLNREAKRTLAVPLANPVIDTFSIYEWLRKRTKVAWCRSGAGTVYRLYDIARHLDIAVEGSHNALRDAFTTAELFQRFLPLLAESGARDLGDLLSIGRPFEGSDRFQPEGEICNF